LCAMAGLLNGLKDNEDENRMETLTMIASNQGLVSLLQRAFGERAQTLQTGHTFYAVKELSSMTQAEETLEEDPDEDKEEDWRTEISDILLQPNLAIKMPRSAAAAQEKAEDTPKIDYDKDESIWEGLISERTRRITRENLEEFRKELPPDVLQNMERPFYRGLAVKGGKDIPSDAPPEALLVWELKNMDSDEDTEAEILYFAAKQDANGQEILREYTHEIADLEISRSFFELTDLEKENEATLTKEGFAIEHGEGRDLILEIGTLSGISLLQKKPFSNTKKLGDLTRRQFKRAITNCLFHDRKGLMEDIAFIPMNWYDRDISSCSVMDGVADGLLLVHKTPSGRLCIDLLFSSGAEYRADMVSMMRYSLKEAREKYGDETEVIIRRHTEQTRALAEKLFPGYRGEEKILGERREQ
ncbi:MAG: hypothetical protein K6A92_05495, partial [Lachnospiraceae bacterium]|nr:hypothetical protein [Lachnospiraceae bacterium]